MGEQTYRLIPRGIDRSATYKVTLDNHNDTFEITGRELAGTGIPIHLDAAMTSELVLYHRA